MLPIVFDWYWTPDRIVFMGYFYLALTFIGGGLALTFRKTMEDLKHGHAHGGSHGHGGH